MTNHLLGSHTLNQSAHSSDRCWGRNYSHSLNRKGSSSCERRQVHGTFNKTRKCLQRGVLCNYRKKEEGLRSYSSGRRKGKTIKFIRELRHVALLHWLVEGPASGLSAGFIAQTNPWFFCDRFSTFFHQLDFLLDPIDFLKDCLECVGIHHAAWILFYVGHLNPQLVYLKNHVNRQSLLLTWSM